MQPQMYPGQKRKLDYDALDKKTQTIIVNKGETFLEVDLGENPKKSGGRIIGKGGETAKRIRNNTGVRKIQVDYTTRKCVLTGSPETLELARLEIEKIMNEENFIPPENVQIQQIGHWNYDPQQHAAMAATMAAAMPAAVPGAMPTSMPVGMPGMAMPGVYQDGTGATYAMPTMPAGYAGYGTTAAADYSALNPYSQQYNPQMAMAYGMMPAFAPPPPPGLPPGTSRAGQAPQRRGQTIICDEGEATMEVALGAEPKKMGGRIIGKGGETAKRIKILSGCRKIQVDYEFNVCVLTGKPETLEPAKQEIEKIMKEDNFVKPETLVQSTV